MDTSGCKHGLGLAEGAGENPVVAQRLLENIVARGVKRDRRRLFQLDGSKALRAALGALFGKRMLKTVLNPSAEKNQANSMEQAA